ncbi:ATP-binding protein [Rhodococcus sp. H29-C3]|uniref:ATP-binding protein n=1 Tax=Rhodococcus sp. H29-C3 TaxID=3046307 RepID=UPI0024BA82F8|nr:ATP-binding protein [Rhodococcus sp. H29-C3]MDJ0363305.1 ATP-binding protein [Rhodococcus sp. H29-C3]
MRPETTALLDMTAPVVVVTGDSGTGKSSVLLAHQSELSRRSVIAPPPVTCTFDSGSLQVAILDGLVRALTDSMANRTLWRNIEHRLENASREMAVDIGKGLAKAVSQEVMAQVKERLGEHAGEGISTFFKTLRQDTTADLRRDLKSRSDTNVVKLLARLCDEVSAALKRNVVLAIDEYQRLTDDDQRALASLSLAPPKRARFVIAWSSAAHEALGGLTRLRETNCGEVVVGGLSSTDVRSMLTRAGLASTHTERVHFLSNGFPLIVEGLIGQIRSGGTLDDYTPPTAFVRSLEDALARLPTNAQVAARQLSVFELPPTESTLDAYLGISATQRGVMREALERENILSVERNGQLWFHESRRSHLWNRMLSESERLEIGQPAYSVLLTQYRQDVTASTGLMVPIAHVARFARASHAANPQLQKILDLSPAELAVLASAIELEITAPGREQDRYTPPETALIYAHNVFGVDRSAALSALPDLSEQGFIQTLDRPECVNADPDVAVTVSSDPTDEDNIVLNGRIQDVLGKTVIPQITDRLVREHFETVRLESTIVITSTGRSDAIELVRNALDYPLYRFNPLRRTVYPLMALWIDYGGHPISLAAIFNGTTDLQKAKKAATAVDEMSYGRRVRTVRTFEDQKSTIPSMRLFRAVYFGTGRPVAGDAGATGNWSMINDGPPLPVTEYAQRQIALLDILRTRVGDLEREVYAINEPRGAAVGQAADNAFFFVELRGSTRVVELSLEQITSLMSEEPFKFARLERLLELRRGEKVQHFVGRTQPDGLIDDPVVSMLDDLWTAAREFNKHQPRCRIKLRKTALTQLLRDAHIRDTTLGRELSERLTIGGWRGHRPQHALRVAIHPGDGLLPPMVTYTQPIGDPSDVQVRFLPRTARPTTPQETYFLAFGEEPQSEPYGDTAASAIAGLLGFMDDEIELVQ